ncbi:MAG: YedE family putative selenium transporter [candidate division WOR-3 bacterium]|nr:YedE family putative selenium transporter [candidate division WOR-3 bacterium]
MEKKIMLSPGLLITGGVMGFLFAFLVKMGNPANMGICVLCFYRDIAGAIGLHRVTAVSYIRPEIIGFIIGGTIFAVLANQMRATFGAKPLWRFIIGILVGYNALIFLGCPIRMFGRISAGDWTALFGLLGVIVAVVVFNYFVKSGLSLGRSLESKNTQFLAWITPLIAIVLLILLILDPAGVNKKHTAHAPLLISLGAGILLGILGQWSSFCSLGGTLDLVMIKSFHRVQGTITFLIVAFIANLAFGQFKPGAHPVAHAAHLWNFLSMFVIGLGSIMLGGCPFKQTIMASRGNLDSLIAIIGMFTGFAIGHNLAIVASPKGVPSSAMIGVIISIIIISIIGFINTTRTEGTGKS